MNICALSNIFFVHHRLIHRPDWTRPIPRGQPAIPEYPLICYSLSHYRYHVPTKPILQGLVLIFTASNKPGLFLISISSIGLYRGDIVGFVVPEIPLPAMRYRDYPGVSLPVTSFPIQSPLNSSKGQENRRDLLLASLSEQCPVENSSTPPAFSLTRALLPIRKRNCLTFLQCLDFSRESGSTYLTFY